MEFAAQYGSALFAGWKLKLQGVRACVDKGLNRGAKPTVRKNLQYVCDIRPHSNLGI